MQRGLTRTPIKDPVDPLAMQLCPEFLRHGQAGRIQWVDVQIDLLEKAILEQVVQDSVRCQSTDAHT